MTTIIRPGATGAAGAAGAGAITDVATRTVSVKAAPYSAKGDGKLVTDAAITTGTAALSSASAAFTVADIGKKVLVTGAGAAGADLVTTILSVAGGVATLAANAGTTVANAWTVYGTDDTTAINAAITAMTSDTLGGIIVFPDGIYIVGGALVAGTNAQIPMPAVAQGSQVVYLKLTGAREMGYYSGWENVGNPVSLLRQGPILQSLFIGGTTVDPDRGPAMIGTPDASLHTNVNLVVQNLGLRAPKNPSLTMVDGDRLLNVKYKDCFADTLGGIDNPPQPTRPTGRAFVGAGFNNDVMNVMGNLAICGYYVGLTPGEHAAQEGLIAIDNCQVSIGLWHHISHGTCLGHVVTQWCPYGISYVDLTSGPAAMPDKQTLDILFWDIEQHTGGLAFSWGSVVAHVYDPTSKLYGDIRVHREIQGGGTDLDSFTTWVQNGATHVKFTFDLDPEQVVHIGEVGHPAFQNSWTEAPFTDGAAGQSEEVTFRKDSQGILHLSGMLTGGASGATAFTLPAGYRPSRLRVPTCAITTNASGYRPVETGTLRIGVDGTVTPYFTTAGGRPQLDGLSIVLNGNRWWEGGF